MTALELSWLPIAPDWKTRLTVLDDGDAGQRWMALIALANARLDALETIRLDRRLRRLFPAPPPELATRPIRLAILASSTVDHLLPAIRVGALRRGLHVTTYCCDYGQYAQELMDRDSGLHDFRPDTVLFALDVQHVLRGFDAGDDAGAAERRQNQITADLVRHWTLARDAFAGRVIQQTLLPVSPSLFGNNEQRLPGSRARAVERLNALLRDLSDTEGIDLLAVDAWAARDGIRAWNDPMLWHRAKQEISPAAAPFYGDLLARLLAAHQGLSRKALVLDLDNTLWGGVIGDDGLGGIVLGQGSALGEAFVAFQHHVRDLARRGVILAVCSKNDEANALEPFARHPEMALERDDIACFVANWTDKATNLREIAARLNIGLDSLAFVDDNPAERAIIRQELPMVAVPELPEDPALFAECLADSGYFEGLSLTAEDRKRTQQYQANQRREQQKDTATDLDSYLRSLGMEMRWSRFDRVNLPRIAQLINKTNQFNLTTRRTTEDEVAAVIGDEHALSFQIRLLDMFGDNGIVAIVLGRRDVGTDALILDTWLMSCRVLGRRVEHATLNVVAAEARRRGAARLVGEYRPTPKNGMVREHYPRLGFRLLSESGNGGTRWELPLDSFEPFPTFIAVTAAQEALSDG